MNLFDQITWQSSINSFLGKKPQEAIPSFMQTSKAPVQKKMEAKTPMQKNSPFIPQVNAWEPLVSDAEIEQMIKAWASDEEIKIIVTELEKERSWQTQETQPQGQSFLQNVWSKIQWAWQSIQNVVGGFVAQTPEIAGNILSEGSKLAGYNPINLWVTAIKAWFSDKTYWQLREEQKQQSEQIKEYGKKWKAFVQKYWAYDTESKWAKVWEFWARVASTIIWPWKIFKTAQEANKIVKGLATLANVSFEWTTAAVTNYVANEWRLPTAKEVWEFIALQWGLMAGGKVFEQVKKLPSARLIPTTITEAGRDIRKWIDIGEAISKTGISFTKWQLTRKVDKIITKLSTQVDNAIDKVIKETWPNNVTISSLTAWLKKELMEDATIKAQLKWTPIQMKQIEEWIDETINAYKNLYKSKKFDLNAQQQLKKDIYTWLENVFNKNFQTSWKITAQQATERQIARKIKTNIETKVPEVIELNKKLAPFLEASKRLSAKWGYSGYLTDILAWWFASWSPTWIITDPVEYGKNFLLWVIAKRAWTSTFAKTTASTLSAQVEQLFKNPTFQKAVLDQYRQLNSNQE